MNDASAQPAPTYLQLRQRILSLNPAELGLTPATSASDVWGVVVEMGYEVGSATLVTLADGTTSLHYSTGGGMLGRGDYAPLAAAAKGVVVEAQKHLYQMSSTTDFSLPDVGQIRFLLLTYAGIFAAEAPEKSLSSGDHPLVPLFQCVQEALGQLRTLVEKKR